MQMLFFELIFLTVNIVAVAVAADVTATFQSGKYTMKFICIEIYLRRFTLFLKRKNIKFNELRKYNASRSNQNQI